MVVNKKIYKRLVRRLTYLSHTRLDISYTVNVISQFIHTSKEVHL